jgi:hypothetical protein
MERIRHRKRDAVQPRPLLPAPGLAPAGASVQVIWGSTTETLELAEMSVGAVFRMLRAPFNIAPAVTALVNGDPVGPDHLLQAGDELEFARPAGEKGEG